MIRRLLGERIWRYLFPLQNAPSDREGRVSAPLCPGTCFSGSPRRALLFRRCCFFSLWRRANKTQTRSGWCRGRLDTVCTRWPAFDAARFRRRRVCNWTNPARTKTDLAHRAGRAPSRVCLGKSRRRTACTTPCSYRHRRGRIRRRIWSTSFRISRQYSFGMPSIQSRWPAVRSHSSDTLFERAPLCTC